MDQINLLYDISDQQSCSDTFIHDDIPFGGRYLSSGMSVHLSNLTLKKKASGAYQTFQSTLANPPLQLPQQASPLKYLTRPAKHSHSYIKHANIVSTHHTDHCHAWKPKTHPVTPTTKAPKQLGVPSLAIFSPTSLSFARKDGIDAWVCGRGVCCDRVRSDLRSRVRVTWNCV